MLRAPVALGFALAALVAGTGCGGGEAKIDKEGNSEGEPSAAEARAAKEAEKAPSTTKVPASAYTWTGVGATKTDWEAAHPKEGKCVASGCNGPEIEYAPEEAESEFETVESAQEPPQRILGYSQAFPEGTSFPAAKRAALRLFPGIPARSSSGSTTKPGLAESST